MSAVVINRTLALPRGASALERGMVRLADAVARWATARAERRQERHEVMLETIHREQTRKADPRAADHMLSQMGLTGR